MAAAVIEAAERAGRLHVLTAELRRIAEHLVGVDVVEEILRDGEVEERGADVVDEWFAPVDSGWRDFTGEPDPVRSGPDASVSLVLDQTLAVVRESDPVIARFAEDLYALGRAALHDVVREERAEIGELLGQELDDEHVLEVLDDLDESLGRRHALRRARSRLRRSHRAASRQHGVGVPQELDAKIYKAFLESIRRRRPGSPPEFPFDDLRIPVPRDAKWVKVGSTERRGAEQPLRTYWPLYCNTRNEWDDDNVGVDVTYLDSVVQILSNTDGTTSDDVFVTEGWLDKPEPHLPQDLPRGWYVMVPEGLSVHLYSWQHVESDTSTGTAGKLPKLVKQLEKKRDSLAKKAGERAAGAVSMLGPSLPKAAEDAAKTLTQALVSWLVGLIVSAFDGDQPFPTVTLAHLTVMPKGSIPLSVVTLGTAGKGGTHTTAKLARFVDPKMSRPPADLKPGGSWAVSSMAYNHREELYVRYWTGESARPPRVLWHWIVSMPNIGQDVLVWRKQREGFGAVVKQVNLGDSDCVYTVLVRADVRRAKPDDVNPAL